MSEIAAIARLWVGTPYRHRAATCGAGCDCLGLLVGVWREAGGAVPDLPPYRADWRDRSQAEALQELAATYLLPTEGIAAGRVLVFDIGTAGPRHCGIAVGAGRFVHAQERLGVVEANLTEGWLRRVSGVFAFRAD